MEKINFENLPSTNTPINATNLNQLQTNVENAINGVVESGSNSNGSWVKFEDGTLIQRGTAQCPADVGYADVTFPVAFIDDGYTIVASHKYTSGDGYGGSLQLTNITNAHGYSTTQAYIYSYLYSGSYASYKRNVMYIATGKWK